MSVTRMSTDTMLAEVVCEAGSTKTSGTGTGVDVAVAVAVDVIVGVAVAVAVCVMVGVSVGGTPRGKGDVLIRFADETETRVRAEVPIKEAPADRNVSLIGLSLIFAVFLVVRAVKRRKSNIRTADPAP